jgi:hypothetical protein
MACLVAAPLAASGCSGAAPPADGRAGKSSAAAAKTAREAPAAAKPGGAGQAAGAQPGLQRQIVYQAQLQIVVQDFSQLPAQVETLVQQFEGYIAHADVTGVSGGRRHGAWTLRLPVQRFGSFLEAARNLGELRCSNTDAQDVSDEYYDLEARIRNKQQEEARLLKHLDVSTGKLEEILLVEKEISRVREDLERMQGRERVLHDLIALATIKLDVQELQLFLPAQTPTFAGRVIRHGAYSLTTMRRTGEGLIIAAVVIIPWLIVLIVLALPGLFVYRIGKRWVLRG